MRDGSQSVRAVAIYHAGEIGVSEPSDAASTGSRGAGQRLDGAGSSMKDRGLAAVMDLFDRGSFAAARLLAAK